MFYWIADTIPDLVFADNSQVDLLLATKAYLSCFVLPSAPKFFVFKTLKIPKKIILHPLEMNKLFIKLIMPPVGLPNKGL